MSGDGFSRENMKKEIAKGNLNIETKGKSDKGILKQVINYQYKMNIAQYIIVIVMIFVGIIISFINKDGIGITVGSLVQGDMTISNITVNLGALLILGGFIGWVNLIRSSNTNLKEK